MHKIPITGHVFIAVSLDGFIARREGSLDWLAVADCPGEDYGYAAFIAGMDALVMGRQTFDTVRQFAEWPYALPVVVMSSTLGAADVPPGLTDHVVILNSLAAVQEHAAAQGWHRLYVDGGMLIRAWLDAGAVQELTINRLPILIGDGRPLFGSLHVDLPLRHIETRSFASGLVQSRYAVTARGGS